MAVNEQREKEAREARAAEKLIFEKEKRARINGYVIHSYGASVVHKRLLKVVVWDRMKREAILLADGALRDEVLDDP